MGHAENPSSNSDIISKATNRDRIDVSPVPNISRRAFVQSSMALASGIALACLDGGDVFSAVPCFADEVDNADAVSSGAETKIVIVRPTQIGIVAYDVTNSSKPVAVPDCKVTLYSRYNNKTLSGTTNAEGKLVFDIVNLAERDDEGNIEDIPEFNGTITVEKQGYRDVVIPLARITGHTALIAPTRPLDDLPYFRSLTFNEWDIQYTAPDFRYDATNTEIQTIAGELYLPDENADVSASLVIENAGVEKTLGDFKVVSKEGHIAKVQIAGDYLNSGKEYVFNDVNVPKVVFSYDSKKSVAALSSNSSNGFVSANGKVEDKKDKRNFFVEYFSLLTREAPLPKNREEDKVIVPSAYGTSANLFRLPDDFIKPFGGSELSIWKPEVILHISASPFGYLMIGVGYNSILTKADDGKFLSSDSWKTAPADSIIGYYKSEIKSQFKQLDAYIRQQTSPNDPKKTKLASVRYIPKFKVTISIQAFACGEYKYKKKYWNLSLSFVASVTFTAMFTFQFGILFVPVFVQVSPSLTFKCALRLGGTAESLTTLSFGNPQNDTAGLGGNFSLSLTLGVGIAGFVSGSVTGSGYVCFFLNYLPSARNKPTPRVMAGYGGHAFCTIQIFIAKYTFPIADYDEPQAYDSDYAGDNKDKVEEALKAGDEKTAAELLGEDVLQLLGVNSNNTSLTGAWGEMPSFEELKQNAVIVTNAERLNSKEFELSTSVQNAKPPVAIEHVLVDSSSNTTELLTVDTGDVISNFSEEDPIYATLVVPSDPDFDPSDASYVPDTSYLPSYEYTGTMHQSLQATADPGVEGISDSNFGGVKPTVDDLLFETVTSNPRLKVFKTKYDRIVMFRIANVDVGGGQIRSRLVYHLLRGGNWTRPYVVEFDPQISGVDRFDMFDADFDIAEARGRAGNSLIVINLTSATYENGDNSTFVEAIQARYASLITLIDSYAEENPLQVDPSMTCNLVITEKGSTISEPAICAYSDELSVVGTNDFCIFATVIRKTVTENGIGTSRRRAFFGRWEYNIEKGQDVFRVDLCRQVINRGDLTKLFPVYLEDDYAPSTKSASKVRSAAGAIVSEGTCYICRYTATYKDEVPRSNNFVSFNEDLIASSDEYHIDKIYRFGADQGVLLASCKINGENGEDTTGIFRLEFDRKNNGDIKFTNIGDTSGFVSDFVSDPDGTYLFYAENIDGKTGQEYKINKEDGSVESIEDIIEHKYYIKAIAYVQGLFTKPFVFAELDHAADNLAATCVDNEYVTFMADDIVDMSKSISNIYDVRVPFVKCITPVALASVDPFCFSGEECMFSVDIRNNGNVVATSATFNFVDVSTGKTIDSKVVDFSKDVVKLEQVDGEAEVAQVDDNVIATQYGTYNTETWNDSSLMFANPLVADNGANVLTPGETESYRVSFKIPEDWADEKIVRVDISNIKYLVPSNADNLLRAEEDVEVQTYYIDEADVPTETINIADQADVDTSHLSSGEVKASQTSDDEQTDHESSEAEDPQSKSTCVPATGDRTGKAGVAMAALGAAAVGFAAYSRRREKLERQSVELGDIDDTTPNS